MEQLTEFEYFSVLLETLNSRLEEFCREKGLVFLQEIFDAVEDPNMAGALQIELTSDGAHFNYDGYEVIGRALCAALQELNGDGSDGGGGEFVKEGDRVLLLGDSITAGYPEYEPLLLGATTETSGTPSATTCARFWVWKSPTRGFRATSHRIWCAGWTGYLEPLPDMVILQGGANDAFNSLPFLASGRSERRAREVAGEIFENFRTMVEKIGKIQKKNIKIVIMPLLPFFR